MTAQSQRSEVGVRARSFAIVELSIIMILILTIARAGGWQRGTMPWAAVDTAKVELDDFIRLHLEGLQTDEPMR